MFWQETDGEDIIVLTTSKPEPELIILETDSEEESGTKEDTDMNPESTTPNPDFEIPGLDILRDSHTRKDSSQQDPVVKDTHTIHSTGGQDQEKQAESLRKSITFNKTREQIKRKLEGIRQLVNDDTAAPPQKSAKVSEKAKIAKDKMSKAQESLKKAREASRVKYGIVRQKQSPKLAKSKAEMAAILNTSLRKKLKGKEEIIPKENVNEKTSLKEKPNEKISSIEKPKEKIGPKEMSYKSTADIFKKSRPRTGMPTGWYTEESHKTKSESSPEFNKTSPDMNSGVMHSRNGQYYLDLTDREVQKKLVAWIGILGIQNQVCFINFVDIYTVD